MRDTVFQSSSPGKLVKIEQGGSAFVPDPLPSSVQLSARLMNAYGAAREAVAKLDSSAPEHDFNPYLVAYPLLLREAFYSSQMEGTYTTPREMALFEFEERESDPQTREVMNYVRAMETGAEQIGHGARVTEALIKGLHRELLTDTRGQDKQPGEYRTRQNFIGSRGAGVEGARFVPPPPIQVPGLMTDIQRYIERVEQSEDSMPLLIALALIHYQFETVHPFNDGNGRIGRLLIPLILIQQKRIRAPLLYISAYMDRTKDQYLDRLLRVSTHGEWSEWILFFLGAITASGEESLKKVARLWELRQSYRDRVLAPRSPALLVSLIDDLFRCPSLTISSAMNVLKVSQPQASAHVRKLEKLGIIREQTGGKRNLRFVPEEILRIAMD